MGTLRPDCVVRYAVLQPERIVNLTSPRYLPEISRKWGGRERWHHPRYEPLRDLIEAHYVRRFNAVSGHYERLLASVARDGFRNPIMVAAGRLERRRWDELPPAVRCRSNLIVSEYLGGSRLWAALTLGIDVPCIVNDYAAVLPDAEVLTGAGDVLARFTDRPRHFEMAAGGPVMLNDLPFMHLPESERYSLRDQIVIRRAIIGEIRDMVAAWLATNDR
jgi:hypothetical protein